MTAWIPWVPGLPLAGFAALLLFGGRLGRRAIGGIGVATTLLSAVLSVLIGLDYPGTPETRHLWSFLATPELHVDIGLRLDDLSLVMMLVVTFVGFLIHLYASELMLEEEGYRRFFATMNLFMAGMLVLVLADNLILLYFGWEVVGFCSYFLIGFWYRDPANGRAARKAFVVTRVGDAALAVGLFLIFARLGTLDIQEVVRRASVDWSVGSPVALATAGLLLAGAAGKSAQLPLHTWLPDAMAGPTPVSALIHAATMVAAGVYLIARTHGLFVLAPSVLRLLAITGAVTLVLAALSATAQRDIKKILAYSTMSQVGYMFLALGVGAVSAAVFHFLTHAFFKALLFLGAGVVIAARDGEHDVFALEGLRREQPLTFWCFLAGAGALAGFPLVTAGFYSKDWILAETFRASGGLWAFGWAGVFLTAFYSFRMVFLVFFHEPGEERAGTYRPGFRITMPLVVLGGLSLGAGFLRVPPFLGDGQLFSRFMEPQHPGGLGGAGGVELWLAAASTAAVVAGIASAYWLYVRHRATAPMVATTAKPAGLHDWALAGFHFDDLYRSALERPLRRLLRASAGDGVDRIYDRLAAAAMEAHRLLVLTENGRARFYAGAVASGAILLLSWMLWSA